MHRSLNRPAWAFLFVIGFAVCANAAGPFYDGIVNKEFKRTITLTTAVARHEYSIVMVNEGSEAQNHFHLAVQSVLSSKLAYIAAFDADGTSLAIKHLEKPQEIVGADGRVAETCVHLPVIRFLAAHGNTLDSLPSFVFRATLFNVVFTFAFASLPGTLQRSPRPDPTRLSVVDFANYILRPLFCATLLNLWRCVSLVPFGRFLYFC